MKLQFTIIVLIVNAFYQGLNYIQQKRNAEKFDLFSQEIKDLWNRANNHKHRATCERKCDIEVDGVLIGDK